MLRRSGTLSRQGQISGDMSFPSSLHFSGASRCVSARTPAALCGKVEDRVCCRFGEWNVKDVDFLNQVQLITAKPVVYLVNLPEKMYIKKKSKWLPKVADPLVPCSTTTLLR